jgi:hypothetical protein
MENIEIHGMSRGAFLVRGAVATGAAYGAASVGPWVTREFGSNEQEHVDALMATIGQLGGSPVKSPEFAFGLKSQADFERLAVTLEDTGVSAYNGAAPMIESKGMNPTLGAFDTPLDTAAVLKAVTPLITACGRPRATRVAPTTRPPAAAHRLRSAAGAARPAGRRA